MVGGSGLRTARAASGAACRAHTLPAACAAAALFLTAGCVYFNAFYNANKLFERGVADIEAGRESSGRTSLGASIEKAERIVQNNPNSRWADDALRLIVRARIFREEWPEAADAAQRLMRYARSHRDSAETAGYLGEAELNLDDPARADSLLVLALSERWGEQRRAELLALRGRARTRLGRREAAEADLRAVSALRPDWVPPRIDRVRLLVDGGQGPRAAEELASLLALAFTDREERQVVETARYVAEHEPDAAIAGLANVESSSLRAESRARLIKLRGELKIARGDVQEGRADYRLTAATAPESRAAAEAQAALVLMDVQAASTIEQFDSQMAVLDHVARQPGGRRSLSVRELHDTFVRMDYWMSTGSLGYLLAAETARDVLDAPRLARRLFLTYADKEPKALWAPKAILAALDLTPVDSGPESDADRPNADELRRRLLEDYGDSAYVRAVYGGGGGRFSFEELELGLRRQLERLENLAEREVKARRSGTGRKSNG